MIDKGALEAAKDDQRFRESGWLTFYLDGPAEQHRIMASDLRKMGAENLDGREYGFVYAKLPVVIEQDEVERVVTSVCELADRHGINVGLIDLDSDCDVEGSKFYTLWRSSTTKPQAER